MARRSGLGRGLGALIPPEANPGAGSGALREVAVSSVRANPHQPRKHFDEESLASLAASIRELGVLQPVLVRETGEGEFELIAGERRWRAAKRAGLPTIPVVIKEADNLASLEQAVVENLHRADLNPLEEAAAYQQLLEDFGMTHEMLAERVGKSRVTITNTLRLFQLPPSIQKLVADASLTAGHARALLGTPDRAFQESVARRVVAEGLSVRSVEDIVRDRAEVEATAPSATEPRSGRKPKLRQAGMQELEDLLGEHLATRVKVQEGRGGGGKVVIEFGDLDDLERLYRVMTEAPSDV